MTLHKALQWTGAVMAGLTLTLALFLWLTCATPGSFLPSPLGFNFFRLHLDRSNELFSCFGCREEAGCLCPANRTGREGAHRQQEGFLLRTHLPLFSQFWPQAFRHSFPKSDFCPAGQFHSCLAAAAWVGSCVPRYI